MASSLLQSRCTEFFTEGWVVLLQGQMRPGRWAHIYSFTMHKSIRVTVAPISGFGNATRHSSRRNAD